MTNKKQFERLYVAKINGMYFTGLSKDKVYADSDEPEKGGRE